MVQKECERLGVPLPPDHEHANNPEKLRKELEDKFNAVRSPIRTAEAFGIEEIIDPRDTRPLLVDWVHQAYEIVPTLLGVRTRTMRP